MLKLLHIVSYAVHIRPPIQLSPLVSASLLVGDQKIASTVHQYEGGVCFLKNGKRLKLSQIIDSEVVLDADSSNGSSDDYDSSGGEMM